MKDNKYKIETVEFYYNGSSEKFDKFLSAVIRDYISEDKILPDAQENISVKSA